MAQHQLTHYLMTAYVTLSRNAQITEPNSAPVPRASWTDLMGNGLPCSLQRWPPCSQCEPFNGQLLAGHRRLSSWFGTRSRAANDDRGPQSMARSTIKITKQGVAMRPWPSNRRIYALDIIAAWGWRGSDAQRSRLPRQHHHTETTNSALCYCSSPSCDCPGSQWRDSRFTRLASCHVYKKSQVDHINRVEDNFATAVTDITAELQDLGVEIRMCSNQNPQL